MIYTSQYTDLDPATYARNQRSHHAAVLQKVLDHSLSILPAIHPSSQSSNISSASSSSLEDSIFPSPTHKQTAFGYPYPNPPIYSVHPNGVDAFNQVPLWDEQGIMKDLNANTFQYPYSMFGTYPRTSQTQNFNLTTSINPGWLHNTQTTHLDITHPPEQFSSLPLRPSPPPNLFDATCYISAVEKDESHKTSKKRRRSTSTKQSGKELLHDVDEDEDTDDDDDELVAVTNSELPGTVVGKKDRRRMQNRLAQRAFRSRSKKHRAEAAIHLQDLEKQSKSQAGRLNELASLIDQLQKENSSLKYAN